VLLVGNLLTRGVGFLLLPLYTHVLAAEDFSFMEAILNVATVVSLVAAHGVTAAMIWALKTGGRAGGDEPDAAEQSRIVSVTSGWAMLSALVVCGGAMLFAGALGRLATGGAGHALTMALFVAAQGLRDMTYPAEGILKVRFRTVPVAVMSFGEFLFAVVGNLVAVVVLDHGITGIAAAALAAAAFRLVLAVVFVPEMRRPRLDGDLIRRLVAYGVPLMPMAIAFNVLSTTDRVLLNQMGYEQAGGLYAYGDKFARILEIGLITPMGMMWPAVFYNIAREPDARAQFARIATLLAAAGGLLGFALTLLGAPLARLLDTSRALEGGALQQVFGRLTHTTGEFEGAASVIGVLTVGYVCYGLNDVARVGFSIQARNLWLAVTVCAAAALNLVLNWFWIPAHGAMGAAWATTVAYGALLAMTLVLSERIYPHRWEWGRLLLLAAVFVGGSQAVGLWAPPDDTWVGLGVRVVALLSAPLVLVAAGFLRPEDKRALRRLLLRLPLAGPLARRWLGAP
jgi:O-antigen/teichoic acid export membrane protein